MCGRSGERSKRLRFRHSECGVSARCPSGVLRGKWEVQGGAQVWTGGIRAPTRLAGSRDEEDGAPGTGHGELGDQTRHQHPRRKENQPHPPPGVLKPDVERTPRRREAGLWATGEQAWERARGLGRPMSAEVGAGASVGRAEDEGGTGGTCGKESEEIGHWLSGDGVKALRFVLFPEIGGRFTY